MGLKIGLVLSRVPNYSETFFLNKIKGLQASGFELVLFAQHTDAQFSLCPVVLSPAMGRKYSVNQAFKFFLTLLHLIGCYPRRVFNFVKIERRFDRAWFQILKNLYTNSHLLKADLDWVHFGFATIALQSESVAEAIGAKMAVSFRGYDITVYPESHSGCYNLLWKQVDKVHSISHFLLQKAYQLGLSSKKQYDIITPAIDIAQFKREDYKFSNTTLKFLTVARLHPVKDLESVINAMAILKRHAVHFTYTIIGEGSEYNALQKQIEKLQLTPYIKLLGKKDHETIILEMQQTDIYIQYSVSEGFCNAVLEAQSVGLLCVVSDGGGLPENILQERTGWVVPKKNPTLLAQSIMNVIHLPHSDKERISKAAQDRVRKDFNLNLQRQRFKAFYEND